MNTEEKVELYNINTQWTVEEPIQEEETIQTEQEPPTSKDFVSSIEKELDKIEEIIIDDLMLISDNDKSDSLLGDRFLTREGSWLIVAQSGIGKSVLAMQMAISFSLGRELFGLKTDKPLKIALIQAENNKLDIAEPFNSILKYYTIENKLDLLKSNFKIYPNSTEAGTKFSSFVDRICQKCQPDIVIVDPLMSYIGGDISRQDVCSNFLRNELHPIIQKHKIGIIFMHHTTKPRSEDVAKRILSYAGAGSADLTNYSRAVSTIFENVNDETVYNFTFSKRGKRFDDTRVAPTIYLKHADGKDIYWEETAEPEKVIKKQKQGLMYDNMEIEQLEPMRKTEMSEIVYNKLAQAGIEIADKKKALDKFWNNNSKYVNERKDRNWLIYNKETNLWQGKFYVDN